MNRFLFWFNNLNFLNQIQCALLPYLIIQSYYYENYGEMVAWIFALSWFIDSTNVTQKLKMISGVLVKIPLYSNYIDQLEDRLMKSVEDKTKI